MLDFSVPSQHQTKRKFAINTVSPHISRKQATSYKIIAPLVLVLIIFLLYWKVILFPFVNWDDFEFIRDNPTLRSATFFNITQIVTPGKIPGEMLYIPLTYLSYLAESAVWGLRPSVVHVNNLLLHIANTFLVFLLFNFLGGKRIALALGSLAFAIHPLMVEAVVWSMGRKDLLSTFFALIAILLYCQTKNDGRKRWYWASLISFSLGLLAKPTLIILPGLLLLIDNYLGVHVSPRQLVLKIPYVLLGLIVFMISLGMPAEHPIDVPSLTFRLLQLPSVISGWGLRIALIQTPNPFYCWPSNYQWQMITFSTVCITLTSGITIYIAALKKLRSLAFGVTFFVISAIPAMSLLITPREFLTADRYGYFPLIGLFYGIVTGLQKLLGRSPRLYSGLVSCWLAAAFLVTYRQIDVWKTSANLWERAKEKCADNVLIYNNLGMAYIDSGNVDQAIDVFKNGLDLAPNYVPLYNNLGRLFFDQGNPEAAQKNLESAVSIAPNNALANKNLGDVYLQLGQTGQAIACFQKSINAKPDNIPAYVSLGNCLLQNNRLGEAETIYKNGLKYDSINPDIHLNLGIIYENQGLHDKAAAAYKQAISSNPALTAAHYNLANIYSIQQRFQLAKTEYLQVIRYAPNHVEAAINLGNLYFRTGKLDHAERCYQTATRIGNNDNPFPHFNLGLIYIRKQALTKALVAFKSALNIQPDFGQAHYEISKAYFLLKDVANAKNHLENASRLGVTINEKFVEELNSQPSDKSTPK